MEFRALGTLEVRDSAGHLLVPARRKQRLVLAVMLFHANAPVTAEMLLEMLWTDAAPSSARANLQSYLSELRRLLNTDEPTGPPRLHRANGGYVLRVEPDELDIMVFERLALEGRQALALQRHVIAAQRLAKALGLWRGAVLQDLPTPDALRPEAERLEQLRLMALEDSVEARLGLEDPAVLAAELVTLTASHPLRERLWGQLMLALYRCGRQADALEAYQRVYRLLDEELAVQPGQALQQLHHQVLSADPALMPPATFDLKNAQVVVPRQLPPAVAHFAGRTGELATLTGLLGGRSEAGGTVVISAIGGTAGVGKTAMAVYWAHRVADRFPDGQLYIDLRGFGPSGQVVPPADAVRRFLDALDVPAQRIPADPDAQTALYRSQLAGRRVLVVLDNARDSAQVRPLLPATAGCLVLVTSRNQLTGLVTTAGAHAINLDLLTEAEAHELLTRRFGTGRVAAEPDAVKEIIHRCARLPLALALVAACAAGKPRAALGVLARELADTRERWQMLTGDDPSTDARAVFSWSYQTLTPPAARLFRLLGLHSGPDIDAPAAASLVGTTPHEVRSLLDELTRASMLTGPTNGRYTLHDLLRDYASQLTDAFDTDEQRHAATGRVLDYYLHTAYGADRLLFPAADPILLAPPRAGVTPQPLSDYAQALDWFTAQHQVLLAAVARAAATGCDTHTWQLAVTLVAFLHRLGHWHDLVAVGQAATAAAQRLADPTIQARIHRLLAYAYTQLGRLDDAHSQLRNALDLATRTGDQTQQANTHYGLSYLWERRGQPAQALHHARQALDLYQATGHQAGGRALNVVGWFHAQVGEYQQALTYCQQALTLHEQLGDRDGQANTWHSLAYAHYHLGQHAQAVTCYEHALSLFRDLGDRHYEADTLTRLGDTHHATGNRRAARDAWQQALTVLNDLDHPDAAQVRTKLTGLEPAGSVVGQQPVRLPEHPST